MGEFVAPHLPAYEFAGELVRRLVAPQTQGQRRRIVAVYLEAYDLACIEASNDRIGGWQLMYQMLQTAGCQEFVMGNEILGRLNDVLFELQQGDERASFELGL